MGFKLLTKKGSDWDPLYCPIALCLYGPQGQGKTTQAVMAFNRFTWFVTRQSAFTTAAKWIKENPKLTAEYDLRIPRNVFHAEDEGYVEGAGWDKQLRMIAKKIRDGKYKTGVVFDEGSTLLEWAMRDAKKEAGGMHFDVIDAMKDILSDLIRSCQKAGIGFIWLAHTEVAKYHVRGASGKEAKSTTLEGSQGELQYKHGPKSPIGTMRDSTGTGQFSAIWELSPAQDSRTGKGKREKDGTVQRLMIADGTIETVHKRGSLEIPPLAVVPEGDVLFIRRLCEKASFNLGQPKAAAPATKENKEEKTS